MQTCILTFILLTLVYFGIRVLCLFKDGITEQQLGKPSKLKIRKIWELFPKGGGGGVSVKIKKV